MGRGRRTVLVRRGLPREDGLRDERGEAARHDERPDEDVDGRVDGQVREEHARGGGPDQIGRGLPEVVRLAPLRLVGPRVLSGAAPRRHLGARVEEQLAVLGREERLDEGDARGARLHDARREADVVLEHLRARTKGLSMASLSSGV